MIVWIKILGAVFVLAGCGGFGFMVAAAHRKETNTLRCFLSALEIMEWELQYRMTPLPELCQKTAEACHGIVSQLFMSLAKELSTNRSPDVTNCIQLVLKKRQDTPLLTEKMFALLEQSLGRFDLEGQIMGLAAVRTEGNRILNDHIKNQENRLRCYQTLGICAGAAIAILFI